MRLRKIEALQAEDAQENERLTQFRTGSKKFTARAAEGEPLVGTENLRSV